MKIFNWAKNSKTTYFTIGNNFYLSKEQADKLKKDTLEFAVKTGEKGEVFGSVKKDQINSKLKEKGYQCEALLSEPLKAIGEHKVAVSFPRGIRGEARVIMKRAL